MSQIEWEIRQGLYIGEDVDDVYVGYIAESYCYGILQLSGNNAKEKGKLVLAELKSRISLMPVTSLSELDSLISDVLVKSNAPLNISLAIGVNYKNIFYLKTMGDGVIYLRRGKDFVRLLYADNRASGFIQDFDCFIFAHQNLITLLGGDEVLKKQIGYLKPEDIINALYTQKDTGGKIVGIALIIEFAKNRQTIIDLPTAQKSFIAEEKKNADRTIYPFNRLINLFITIFSNTFFSTHKLASRKTLTLLAVVVIAAILFWSVVFGRQRQLDAQLMKKIGITRDSINRKLTQAEDVSFLDIGKSAILIAEAKKEVVELQQELNGKKQIEVDQLEKLIKKKEEEIMKKEEKNFQEFYDLALEDKDARGDAFYLDGEDLAILDKKGKIVYFLSLVKKSVETRKLNNITQPLYFAFAGGKLYFGTTGGIFEVSDDNKIKKVIDADKDWGDILSLQLYNNNIYLLDRGKDEIYKYLRGGSGFSDKMSYFKSGQAVDLADTTSFAIDSAIYISFSDSVIKYLAGQREEFKTDFPASSVTIKKIYTNKSLDHLYVWDKKQGVLYVLSKQGDYERQIKSAAFNKGDDLIIYGKSAYVLIGQKIFSVEID